MDDRTGGATTSGTETTHTSPSTTPSGGVPAGSPATLQDWQLTPQRILLLLAILCFGLAFFGGFGGVNLIALGLALGFASFAFES